MKEEVVGKMSVADLHVRLSERPRLPELAEGRFGRLFPDLPAHDASADMLLHYGAAGGPLESQDNYRSAESDNPGIPAGWPFFGQFIAHDITHDRAPLQAHEDVNAIRNFRSPRLDLECVYGAGPVGQPYLYDLRDADKLLVAARSAPVGDLPRNEQGMALVGDARNDTHLFISQLHLAFLHFHNRCVDLVRGEGAQPDDVFGRARQLVRWHYQWIVVHQFLPLHLGEELVEETLTTGPKLCTFTGKPFIPVEFSDGVYRFGHAQVRATYDVNEHLRNCPLFPNLVGIRSLTPERQVDWKRMFAFPGAPSPLASRRITPKLVAPLMRLPEQIVGRPQRPEFSSLAARDLYRGRALDLPSGEAIAQSLGLVACTRDEMKTTTAPWSKETPLWLYVLKEAEVQQQGQRLGELGGRILAEVLIELLRLDPTSFLSQPSWKPSLAGPDASFGIADLLRFAVVA